MYVAPRRLTQPHLKIVTRQLRSNSSTLNVHYFEVSLGEGVITYGGRVCHAEINSTNFLSFDHLVPRPPLPPALSPKHSPAAAPCVALFDDDEANPSPPQPPLDPPPLPLPVRLTPLGEVRFKPFSVARSRRHTRFQRFLTSLSDRPVFVCASGMVQIVETRGWGWVGGGGVDGGGGEGEGGFIFEGSAHLVCVHTVTSLSSTELNSEAS